ncbi:MAG TPA: LacI family DNA-binding transcriptional regulator [Lichenihabitans sp.]|nr:LacI family DNA-binding transcriptional regulator [Lichenihabitans sp.]
MKSEARPVEEARNVTLKDVAQAAGVSRATVSLVLRRSPLVAPATRQHVEAMLAAVGYVYNRGAARLRTGTSGTIGLIVPEITNPFYAELTAGIDEILDRAGRLTFLANSNDRPDRQDRFIRRIREHGVDGIILCAAEGTPQSLPAQLKEWRLACVQVLRSIGDGADDFVAPDFAAGTLAAIDHLVAHGHRRIALMPSTRKTSAARERVGAFEAAMRGHGLEPGAIAPCVSSRIAAAEGIGRLLDGRDRPTAVVCHNDLMALGAIAELRRRGIAPGREVSIVGFDDIPEAADASPALSTVATAPLDVGREAARLLLRRIAAPDDPPERILIPPTLIVRDT